VTRLPNRVSSNASSRRWLAAAGAALVIVIAVMVVVIAGGGSSGKSPRAAVLPALHPHRAGPESMFTVATELTADPAGTLNALQSLGVDRIHIYMHWADIAPDPRSRHRPNFDATDPAAYPATGWAVFDTILRDARARGIGVDLALVPPPPLWAAGKGAPDPSIHPYWRPSASEFGQFVRAVGTRYSGHYVPSGAAQPLPRVDFWSIWNEPNLGTELAPEAKPNTKIEIAPSLYRGLVDAAWSAFGATGHAHDTILIGEIAPAGATFQDAPGLFANMAPLRFLRALYCVGADYRPLQGSAARVRDCPTTAAGTAGFAAAHPGLFHASGFADHPYPQGLAPDTVTPNEPDYAELAAIGKLERTLDTLQGVYGSHNRLPIWSTEFGYQTTPPDPEGGTVSPARAAYYLNWAEYLTWLDPRQLSYDQYQLRDSPAGIFATGLLTTAGTPKPGFYAYRMPIFLPATATLRHHPLVVWGCVRPAPDAARASHRLQRVQIEFKPASGATFATVQTVSLTGPHGYFEVRDTFPGTGTVRLAWRYPHGPQIFSRAVTVMLR
jgi:hypothetical protein